MKLISMTDFVFNMYENWIEDCEKNTPGSYIVKTGEYCKFLRKKLELWMFVPCKLVDGVWVVLEKPAENMWNDYINSLESRFDDSYTYCFEYDLAQQNVLFKDFEAIKWDHGGQSYSVRKNHGADNEVQVCYYKAIPDYFVWSFDLVEQLCSKDLELTGSGQKQMGL